MILFNKTEGLFCQPAPAEPGNTAREFNFQPQRIHSFLPAATALEKGVLPRSSSRVFVNGNEARILSPENATLVFIHSDLKPVSVDGKAIAAPAESQSTVTVELSRGWHSIRLQNKNGK
jgi:hypothetical protein